MTKKGQEPRELFLFNFECKDFGQKLAPTKKQHQKTLKPTKEKKPNKHPFIYHVKFVMPINYTSF